MQVQTPTTNRQNILTCNNTADKTQVIRTWSSRGRSYTPAARGAEWEDEGEEIQRTNWVRITEHEEAEPTTDAEIDACLCYTAMMATHEDSHNDCKSMHQLQCTSMDNAQTRSSEESGVGILTFGENQL
eukprot:5702158-Amphidinium_carterae.1